MEKWIYHQHVEGSENSMEVKYLFDALDTIASLKKGEKIFVVDGKLEKKTLGNLFSRLLELFQERQPTRLNEHKDPAEICKRLEEGCINILELCLCDEKCLGIFNKKLAFALRENGGLITLAETYQCVVTKKSLLSTYERLGGFLVVLKLLEFSEKICKVFCTFTREKKFVKFLKYPKDFMSLLEELERNVGWLIGAADAYGENMSLDMKNFLLLKLNHLHFYWVPFSTIWPKTILNHLLLPALAKIVCDYLQDYSPYVWDQKLKKKNYS